MCLPSWLCAFSACDWALRPPYLEWLPLSPPLSRYQPEPANLTGCQIYTLSRLMRLMRQLQREPSYINRSNNSGLAPICRVTSGVLNILQQTLDSNCLFIVRFVKSSFSGHSPTDYIVRHIPLNTSFWRPVNYLIPSNKTRSRYSASFGVSAIFLMWVFGASDYSK